MEHLIPVVRMNELERKLKSLKRKADKSGTPFSYEVVGDEYAQYEGHMIPCKRVKVDCEVRMNGYELIAEVDHTHTGGNIVLELNGKSLPKEYWDCKPFCEHCRKAVYRNASFFVEKDGEIKQVGKNCLKEYTEGLSADFCAELLNVQSTMQMSESLSRADDLDGFILSRSSSCISRMDAVCNAFRVVSEKGYNKDNFIRLAYGDDFEKGYWDKRADSFLEWVESLEEDSSYVATLKALCRSEWVDDGYGNFIGSAVAKYIRETSYRDRSKSGFVGEEGERIKLVVKSIRAIYTYATFYGQRTIWELMDDEGNVFICKPSHNALLWDIEYEVGEKGTANVVATVKGHSDYRGVKQTEIQRLKMVDKF